MDINNKEYKVKLSFYNTNIAEFLKLKIDFIPYDIGSGEFEKFELEKRVSFDSYRAFIGVKKIQIKNLKTRRKVKFLLNISLNKNDYKTIKEYKEILSDAYLHKELEKDEALQELEYRNFEDEFNIFLCTYLLTKESLRTRKRIFNKSLKIFELYMDKLYFIGIDLEDYKDSKYSFQDWDGVREDIKSTGTIEALKDYFFSYIAYLAYYDNENTMSLEQISAIFGSLLTKYISLLR